MTLELILAAILTPQTLNLLFAALCFAASRGFCANKTMLLSALLYLALAFCPG